MSHKAGFINIIGSPNVGKSTLMNQILGEKLSIITSKNRLLDTELWALLAKMNIRWCFQIRQG